MTGPLRQAEAEHAGALDRWLHADAPPEGKQRFVFRSNPALLRQVTSRYERTRKGKKKGKKNSG